MTNKSKPERSPRPLRAVVVRLIVCLGLMAATAQSPAEQAVKLSVDPSADLGPLPRLFRPSVMASWAQAEAVNAFLSLPGDLGAIRVTLEQLIQQTNTLEAYTARLTKEAHSLRELEKRNAEVIVTLARTPSWLAGSKETKLASPYGFALREALPPRDQAGYAEYVEATVRILNQQIGLKPWYEFWNEPDLDGFWRGTPEQLFATYASFLSGARRADPAARVGGLCTSGWYQKGPGKWNSEDESEALLSRFLRFIRTIPQKAGERPIDFVCWHNFGSHPEQEWWGADEIHTWLRREDLPGLPQLVTEWNLWSTFPAWLDPQRDSEVGAAYIPAALHAMEAAGITMQTFATLQDYRSAGNGNAFPGDFGLLTREPMLEKASFIVMRMLAMLESRRIAVSFADPQSKTEGINAIATKNGEKIAILVHRYGNDFAGTFIRSLKRSGYPRGKGLNINAQQLDAFASGKTDLDRGEASAGAKIALVEARSAAQRARQTAPMSPMLNLTIAGRPSPFRYRVYLVDAQHGNPAKIYRTQRAQGTSHAQALSAARAVSFSPLYSGVGAVPPIPLRTYSVALILLDPP